MTPSTPSIGHIHALQFKLEEISEEGLEARFARHARTNALVHDWVRRTGFDFFAEEGFRSKTLTCVENSKGICGGAAALLNSPAKAPIGEGLQFAHEMMAFILSCIRPGRAKRRMALTAWCGGSACRSPGTSRIKVSVELGFRPQDEAVDEQSEPTDEYGRSEIGAYQGRDLHRYGETAGAAGEILNHAREQHIQESAANLVAPAGSLRAGGQLHLRNLFAAVWAAAQGRQHLLAAKNTRASSELVL